jgi:hypothetical protein
MSETWTITQDYKTGCWLGVSDTLKLSVEADSLPALRESIEEAECLRACDLAAEEGATLLSELEKEK